LCFAVFGSALSFVAIGNIHIVGKCFVSCVVALWQCLVSCLVALFGRKDTFIALEDNHTMIKYGSTEI